MLKAGDQLGAYELHELVGRGETGVVFRAHDVRLGRQVALRIVDPELAGDPVVRTRLNRESTVLAQLDHPNVVPLYEAEEIEDRLCLVSRWVDGRSLARVVGTEGPLEPRRAVRLVTQVAAALQAAHDLDVIHRDVKPSSVLVTADDHAYLTDFRLARRSTDTAGMTAPDELTASLDYIAPETISGAPVDHRVDIYGLGLVLFEALTAEVPFPRSADPARVYAHLSVAPPRIVERRRDVSDALDRVVQRALAKAPEDRQGSADAFAREAFDAVELTRPPRLGHAPAPDPEAEPAAAPSPRGSPRPFTPSPPAAAGLGDPAADALGGEAAPPGAGPPHPPRRGGRMVRWAVGLALLLAFLAVPAGLLLALRDEDAGTRTKPGGAAARGIAVAGDRVFVALDGGRGVEAVPLGGARRRSRIDVGRGEVLGVASRGDRLLVATDRALVDIPGGDPSAAVRTTVKERVGALAVGGGSSWAATIRRPGLLRLEAGRLARVPLKGVASALAVGPGILWVADAARGTVFGVDTRTRVARTKKVRVGRRPVALAATGQAVWVVLASDSAVVRLDPRTGRPNLPPIPVSGRPVAIAADSRQVWVARRGADAVTRLDARTGRPMDEVGTARSPVDVALSEDAAWVVGADGGLTRLPR